MDDLPVWPPEAVFAPRGLTESERRIAPRAWWCPMSDGYRIAVQSWPATGATRGDVVVLHGVQSHAGWYHGLGRRLAASGFATHFPDRRGSGANLVARGHASSAQRLVDDVAEVIRRVRNGSRMLVLAGISWGGKLAVAAAAQGNEPIDGLALICPGLHPRVGVGLREKLGVALAVVTGRAATRVFPIPLANPTLFTDDPEARRFIAADPLSLRAGTAGLMFASRVLDGMVAKAPARIETPVLMMLAGRDRIVENRRTWGYFFRIAAVDRTLIDYPTDHHTLDFEIDPQRYARELANWMEKRLVQGECERTGDAMGLS